MIRSRGLRIFLAGAAAVALLACGWVSLGNAYAAKREREATQVLERAFGPRAALESKYAPRETNAEARRAEELVKNVGYDLTPKLRGSRNSSGGGGFSEKERGAISDYVTAQLVRPDEAAGPPPSDLEAILEKHRSSLTAFEEFLVSSPPPKWAFDPRADFDAGLEPNGLGHMQTQRLLIADALASAARGDRGAAARALEGSWQLNQSLVIRPEMVSQIIATAVARLEAGTLRKIDVPAEVWSPRLEPMGSRTPLVDALVIEHERFVVGHWYRQSRRIPEGVGWWWHNVVVALQEPGERLVAADYGEAYARALAGLRDGPPFSEAAPEGAPGRGAAAVILSISIPNIRNSFQRADRLALDSELTTKILRMKEFRRARGAWPEPSPEISASRFPGLSWRYAVADGAMTIGLAATLPEPKIPFVLPTSFSSRAPAP